jgi:hypothetical protein
VGRQVTIQEATRILGLSEGAVRKRVKRGTLTHERDEDGRIWVELDAGSPGVDEVLDEVPHPHSEALISELRDRVASLERQLDVRAEEMHRKDTIIMSMTEAMKAISPPAQEESSEPRESPVTATEEELREEPPAGGGVQEGAQRPWWRRMFGG